MKGIKNILKFPILLLSSLVAIALVANAIFVYIPPSKLWFSNIIGLSFPFLLGLNLLAAFFYMFCLKKRCLIFFAAILLNYSNLSNFVSFGSKNKDKEESLHSFKIASYNVKLFDSFSKTQRKGNFKDSIINFMNESSVDIIAIQEYYSQIETVNNSIYKYSTKPLKSKSAYYGNVILSKYPIVRQDTILNLSKLRCVFADICLGFDTIRLYSMHLSSFGIDNKDREFYNEVINKPLGEDIDYKGGAKNILRKFKRSSVKHERQIELIKESIASSPYPVILCGDMNETPISYSYRLCSKGLVDCFKEKATGISATYNDGVLPTYRIDYAFLSPQKEGFKSLTTQSYSVANLDYSDHLPVICKIGISEF